MSMRKNAHKLAKKAYGKPAKRPISLSPDSFAGSCDIKPADAALASTASSITVPARKQAG